MMVGTIVWLCIFGVWFTGIVIIYHRDANRWKSLARQRLIELRASEKEVELHKVNNDNAWKVVDINRAQAKKKEAELVDQLTKLRKENKALANDFDSKVQTYGQALRDLKTEEDNADHWHTKAVELSSIHMRMLNELAMCKDTIQRVIEQEKPSCQTTASPVTE